MPLTYFPLSVLQIGYADVWPPESMGVLWKWIYAVGS